MCFASVKAAPLVSPLVSVFEGHGCLLGLVTLTSAQLAPQGSVNGSGSAQ